ncbi:MAG: hypothetical protein JNM14_01480 [Ferruginibacter sp.]|nr:hypothetical protein [Ferruginibacter sp.]
MKIRGIKIFILVAGLLTILSCQKEIDGTNGGTIVPPADQKPKVGTTWTYYYYWWNSPGGLTNSKIITHIAKSEETLGGEKWLKIVDVETDTTVYYLNTKVDGLYQYINSTPFLLCKYPASVNDSYLTFFGGTNELFTVKNVNDTTATGIGAIPLNKYEGVFDAFIKDILWYNKNAWIVWRQQYKKLVFANPPNTVIYLQSSMYINSIVY